MSRELLVGVGSHPLHGEVGSIIQRLQYHGSWQKTQGSWVRHRRGCLTRNNSSRQSIILFFCQFSKTQFPQAVPQALADPFTYIDFLLQRRNPELKNPKSLILDYKQTCPVFPHKETLSLFYWTVNTSALCCSRRDSLCLPRLFAIHTSLKIKFKMKEQLVPLFSGCEGLWEIYGEQSYNTAMRCCVSSHEEQLPIPGLAVRVVTT